VACAESLDGQASSFAMILEAPYCPLPGCQARVYNKTLIKVVGTSEWKASTLSGWLIRCLSMVKRYFL
jgi:hypothetical protein